MKTILTSLFFLLPAFFCRRIYFSIRIGKKDVGKITFNLFDEQTPKTCENFYQLSTNHLSKDPAKKALAYKGSRFHRIIGGFMAQGGDFTKSNGTGGKSIYGEKFEDENFINRHTKRGILSMANAGPNTNGSQFFITFEATPHLDKKHVVFGEICAGMEVLDLIEENSKLANEKKRGIVIVDCGE